MGKKAVSGILLTLLLTSMQGYEANSDINGDGIIDIFDVVACTSHYDETW